MHAVRARTSALCFGVVKRPPRITTRAFRSTINITTRAALRHAILACTRIRCKKKHKKHRHNVKIHYGLFPEIKFLKRTNALCAVMVDCPPDVARRTF